jgi:hypothetical protein
MSESKKMNQKRMLATLATLLQVYVQSGKRIPELERDLKDGAVRAIRALIEEVEEWSKRAGKIHAFIVTPADFRKSTLLLMDIRNFLKEADDE